MPFPSGNVLRWPSKDSKGQKQCSGGQRDAGVCPAPSGVLSLADAHYLGIAQVRGVGGSRDATREKSHRHPFSINPASRPPSRPCCPSGFLRPGRALPITLDVLSSDLQACLCLSLMLPADPNFLPSALCGVYTAGRHDLEPSPFGKGVLSTSASRRTYRGRVGVNSCFWSNFYLEVSRLSSGSSGPPLYLLLYCSGVS